MRLAALVRGLVLAACAGCGGGDDGPPAPPPRFVPLGVTFSPVGLPDSLTPARIEAFFADAPRHGSVVAFHSNWRDGIATAGSPPALATFAAGQSRQRGFALAMGFGWADGAGRPDLASAASPADNSWTNVETRADFLQMVTDFARAHRPAYLFLGNETNVYWLATGGSDWSAWVSEFVACRAAIAAASPQTEVFTVFQLERMAGLGRKNGWSDPPHWQLLDDFAAAGAGVGFTTYPYFEYETPAEIPADYYTRIAALWFGRVHFTELGWITAGAPPYTGSPAEQADFVTAFFARTAGLNLGYATYLFLNDPAGLPAAFREIGLRDARGVPRPADAVWLDAVGAQSDSPSPAGLLAPDAP